MQRLFLFNKAKERAHNQQDPSDKYESIFNPPHPPPPAQSFHAPSHVEHTSLVKIILLAVSWFIEEQTLHSVILLGWSAAEASGRRLRWRGVNPGQQRMRSPVPPWVHQGLVLRYSCFCRTHWAVWGPSPRAQDQGPPSRALWPPAPQGPGGAWLLGSSSVLAPRAPVMRCAHSGRPVGGGGGPGGFLGASRGGRESGRGLNTDGGTEMAT